MLNHRASRGLAAGLLTVLAVTGLAGCRNSPSVAAYVGDARITVAELRGAVDERLSEPALADYADGREPDFTRQVLTFLVQEEVYTAAAQRYDVRVGDDEVRDRLEQLLQGRNPDDVYAQLAQQGVGRTDLFENVRQQMVRRGIAEQEGLAQGLDEATLRARYEEVRPSLGEVELGYITVPDQALADQVLARLTADPAGYPQVAAQYPGDYTLPDVRPTPADQVPGPLADQIAGAAPGTGFTVPVQETGGVVVAFVAGLTYPSFEEVRPQLEQEAASGADEQVAAEVDELRSDLGVTVNPRYGTLEEGQVRPLEGGVVDLLDEDPAADPAAGPGAGAGGPGD